MLSKFNVCQLKDSSMGLFHSVFKKFYHDITRKNGLFSRRYLKFESLEDRSLLSAVPSSWALDSVEGIIDNSTSPKIILSLQTESDKEVIIGIDIAAREGSSLKPGNISVFSYDAETGIETDVTEYVTYLNLEGRFEQESLIYARLSGGEYHLTVNPEDGTEGSFTASAFLVGDSDGSGRVDRSDNEFLSARISAIQIHNRGVYSQPTINLYQSRYGIDITNPVDQIYSNLCDYNLDGHLNSADIELINSNLGNSVIADLEIQIIPTPQITPLPYKIPEILDSDDFNAVDLNVPLVVTVQCESSTVDSFTVSNKESMIPSLSLTTSDGTVYSTKDEQISYWEITEDEYDAFLSDIAAQTTLADNVWTFQNIDGLFDQIAEGDNLSMTFVYTVNSFVYEGVPYKSSKNGTITLSVLGTEGHSDPIGPSAHTASFDVGTGRLFFDEKAPTLNVLDGVVDPHGYEMSAELISITPYDASYTVSPDAISISSDGIVEVVPEILAEDFESLKRGETTFVAIAYRITDTHSGNLDGTITLTVTGGNHAPTGETSHTAEFTVSTGSVVFDDLYASLNLFDWITDPDGDALTAEIIGLVQPSGYTVSDGAVSISESGAVQLDKALLQSDFSSLPVGESSLFTIYFTVYDSYGESIDGEIVVTVFEGSEGPQGVTDHTATVNLKNSEVTYDGGKSSLNLLDGVTDAQGLTLSVLITDINSGAYSLPIGAITQTDGTVTVKIDDFQEVFKNLPLDETSEVLVTFAVSDSAGKTVVGELVITVIGKYVSPYEIETLSGIFNIGTSILEFSSGEIEPDILYGIANPSGCEISGQLISVLPPEGYTLSENAILLVDSEDGVQRLVINAETLADDFDLLPLDETVNIDINLQLTDNCGSTLSRTVRLSVVGAYEPDEHEVAISLVATVDPTTDGVTTLKTGANNFGTFYYLPSEEVPLTDYQSVAAADKYYLEVWVNDTNYNSNSVGKKTFISSIQVQFNYDNSESSPVQSIKLEDEDSYTGIMAGKSAISEYLFYDTSENYLKAFQVGWTFNKESSDWGKLEPITNGDNAYLLARFLVTLNAPYLPGFNTSITGVTDSVSPFVDGWYYVRTGDNYPINDSEIITIDVEF